MALEWLKPLLGAAYTPEIDAAVAQEIDKGFVARTDFDANAAKVTELETEVTQLRGDIETRDTQLEELKKSAGDNADLKKQIEELTAQNKADKAAHDKELAAVDAELTAAGSKNNTAVKAVLADFLKDASIQDGKVTSKVNGESLALAEKIEAMKKDAATDGHWKRRSCWAPRRGQAPALRCGSGVGTGSLCT